MNSKDSFDDEHDPFPALTKSQASSDHPGPLCPVLSLGLIDTERPSRDRQRQERSCPSLSSLDAVPPVRQAITLVLRERSARAVDCPGDHWHPIQDALGGGTDVGTAEKRAAGSRQQAAGSRQQQISSKSPVTSR